MRGDWKQKNKSRSGRELDLTWLHVSVKQRPDIVLSSLFLGEKSALDMICALLLLFWKHGKFIISLSLENTWVATSVRDKGHGQKICDCLGRSGIVGTYEDVL